MTGGTLYVADQNPYSRETDLTGLWSGHYSEGRFGPTPFSAHIAETAGSLTGTTLEPATFGAPFLLELSADITGGRTGQNVHFTKIYHPAPGVHRTPIAYSGTVDEKLSRIEGEWRFPDGWSGLFVLVRASRGAKAEAEERKVAEPVAGKR